MNVVEPKKFVFNSKLKVLFAALAILGAIAFFITLKADPKRAWASYLWGYTFWLFLGLGGLFFTALHHIVGAHWGTTVRRVAESTIAYLPIAVLLFIGLLFGLHELYEWTHTHVVEADPLLKGKVAYLNIPFFTVRSGVLFLIALGLGGWLVRNSLKQDQTGDAGLTKKNIKISALFIFFFAWAFSFVAIDLLKSLEPHWFSTVFSIYCWAGLFTSSLAVITLWVIKLKKQGPLQSFVTEDHLHDLSKLMFAFTVFWAYIAFSQYMLIWYANLPEETFYFIHRYGAWEPVSKGLVVVKFILPFFILIGRPAKRSFSLMKWMCFLFLFAQAYDLYWLIYPALFKAPVLAWHDVAIFLGFGGLFFLSVGFFLARVRPVAIKDPRLQECLHHHQ